MIEKIIEKKHAIELRKQGRTYSEILDRINVAKSTLSLWLREVGLSKAQKQRITKKKIESALRGARVRHNKKIDLIKRLEAESKGEIGVVSKRELFLLGVALYWAEGSKEKVYGAGINVQFSNSDPRMIKLFLLWLKQVGVSKDRIKFELFIHENNKYRLKEVINFWSEKISIRRASLSKVYFKKHKFNTNRKNVKTLYYGLLRVTISASSDLNRKISGWISGILLGNGVIGNTPAFGAGDSRFDP